MDIIAKRASRFSPLRYPGGKSALSGFLSSAIRAAKIHSPIYVEPYAGGAGAALALLLTDEVKHVVINDFDPAIYAFWDSVVNRPKDFLDRLLGTEVTMETWRQQKKVYAAKSSADISELGFATFFLNRTNRSGVLNAGVIGGQAQAGSYKIDARFNKKSLGDKVQAIAEVAGRITVTNEDGRETIRDYVDQSQVLIYADPPYFEKGSVLYLNSFGSKDHEDLASLLNCHADCNWILSYDNAPEIVALYPKRHQELFSLYYSAHRNGQNEELMVLSDAMARALTDPD